MALYKLYNKNYNKNYIFYTLLGIYLQKSYNKFINLHNYFIRKYIYTYLQCMN